ncbi:MAG: glycosyltransferase family 2 protein [Candidatus Kapaibacterium sp.]
MNDISTYDLAVAYRIYPGISKNPAAYAHNKLGLAELCVRSFYESLGALRAKIIVLLDNCPPEFEAVFLRYFAAEDVEFVYLSGEGNARTFKRQIDILLEQPYSEYIYFAEDDYFYLPDQFAAAVEFMKILGQGFISLYDHIDTYEMDIHDYPERITVAAGKHWRTAGSTCLTFLTTKATLRATKKVFLTYSKKNYDASIWFALTKRNLRNPLKIIKSIQDISLLKLYGKAWLYTAGAIIFGKKWYLWTPIPSGCTHLESTGLAPGIDWEAHFQASETSISSIHKN